MRNFYTNETDWQGDACVPTIGVWEENTRFKTESLLRYFELDLSVSPRENWKALKAQAKKRLDNYDDFKDACVSALTVVRGLWQQSR